MGFIGVRCMNKVKIGSHLPCRVICGIPQYNRYALCLIDFAYTVEPRYYVPRLQRFHPYKVQIPKSRISVMHYILYRYRLQRTPLQRNFRYNVQISPKNMKNGLRYNVQRGSISAVKRAKGR